MTDQLTQQLPHVYRFALRLTAHRQLAEDLAQETMLRAVRNAEQAESVDRLRVWLFRILVNLWTDHLRREGRRAVTGLMEDPVVSATPEAPLLVAEQRERVLKAIDSLPEKQRAVLYLFAVEELPLADIARVLGLQPGTVRVNLFHARKAMIKKLPHLARQAAVVTGDSA